MPKKAVKKREKVTIESAIKSIKEKFGDDAITMLDQAIAMDVETTPTGSFGLDIALGVGGYPRGRMIEIFGPESSGKTTLALHAVAEAQKAGGMCAYIDAEHALDPEYAKRIGVDTSKLLVSQPGSGEEGLQMVETMVSSGQFALIVVDSVASLTPKAEIEGDIGDANVGRHAKLMSQALRILVPVANKTKTTVIFINQIRMNIGVMPGASPEFTPGGKALKFYCSVRVDIRRIAQIKKGDEVVGSRTKIKVVKNKVAPPFRVTELDILYGEGISTEGEILALGEKYGILTRSGTSYEFGEARLGRGYDASRTYLKENKDIAVIIRNATLESLEKERAATPVTVDEEDGITESEL